MLKKQFTTCVVVIILTLLFNFLYEWNQNGRYFCVLLLICICSSYTLLWYQRMLMRKKILESLPHVLSLLIMSMSMGKSLRYAFEKVLRRKKMATDDFYHEIFQKIFVLREPKSCFGVQDLDNFYEFLFHVSLKSSYQLQSLRSFHAQCITKARQCKKRRSIMLPVWIQTSVMLILYMMVQVWNIMNKSFSATDFAVTGVWYGFGIVILVKQQIWMDRKV